jgi:hypothetical protein
VEVQAVVCPILIARRYHLRKKEVNILKRMTRAPRRVTKIMKFKTPTVNERALRAIAGQFKLKGKLETPEISKDQNALTYKEGPFVVTLRKRSGAVRYYDSNRWQMDDGKSNVRMSDAQAVNIAKAFLRSTKLVPLRDCKLLKVSRLCVGSMRSGDRRAEERVIDAGVVFQRTIGGIPVEGPGGKVMVYMDAKGDVTGCDKIWRDIERLHRSVPTNQLRAPKVAEDDVTKYWKKTYFSRVDVVETRFGYFELGPGDAQRYIQPAYVMPLKLVSGQGQISMDSLHVTLASSRPVGRIMPARKRLVPEPLRRG